MRVSARGVEFSDRAAERSYLQSRLAELNGEARGATAALQQA